MDSALTQQYQFLARYNRWFNQRLYAVSGKLSEEDRRRDRGAFFGSIHRTLKHLVWADQVWLTRFAAQGVSFPPLNAQLLSFPCDSGAGTEPHPDWNSLSSQRERLDAAIEQWTLEMPADFPGLTMRYANRAGVQREHPAWQALTHFFNHQTHHRGQVTTLLSQAGADPGVTDLLALV